MDRGAWRWSRRAGILHAFDACRQAADFTREARTLKSAAEDAIEDGVHSATRFLKQRPHHDRHVLKSGFRSILRLIEFTGNSPWFEA